MALPLFVGAAHATRRLVALAADTVGAAGWPGASFGVPVPDGDQAPAPKRLAARTCTS